MNVRQMLGDEVHLEIRRGVSQVRFGAAALPVYVNFKIK